MRKLILSINMSLDGFATGENDDMSWLDKDNNQDWDDLFEMLSHVDLFVMGGGMWEGYKDYWKKALKENGFSKNEVKYARFAEKTKHIIFSSTLKDTDWENAVIEKEDAANVIKRIKSAPGKDIHIVGGADFASNMIDSGLVDEYRMMLNPVIIGKGKSIFNITTSYNLKRTNIKALDNGVTVLTFSQLNSRDTDISL